jgi:hypothetical protein
MHLCEAVCSIRSPLLLLFPRTPWSNLRLVQAYCQAAACGRSLSRCPCCQQSQLSLPLPFTLPPPSLPSSPLVPPDTGWCWCVMRLQPVADH